MEGRNIKLKLALILLLFCSCGNTGNSSGPIPDLLVVNYSANPGSGMAVSWRTNSSVSSGYVEFKEQGSEKIRTVNAAAETIDSKKYIAVKNDPVIKRFSAELTSLTPDTSYSYRACASADQCSSWHQFTTAPADPRECFAFAYLGDSQLGGLAWSNNFHQLIKKNPQIRFAIIAGDLVDLGGDRSQIDEFLSQENFASIGFLPVPGNHDVEGKGGELYTKIYSLPANGATIPEHDYWIKYGSTLIMVLDSANPADYAGQAAWVEKVVSENPARWKIISFHYPIWSSLPGRDNADLRKALMPVLEKTGVHLVLNGHDHAYLRTYPLIDGKAAAKGPVYMIAVSGPKHYLAQIDSEIIVRKFTLISTYQKVEVSYDKIRVSAYSWNDELLDSFEVGGPSEN
jgi:acid phosphatase type 7